VLSLISLILAPPLPRIRAIARLGTANLTMWSLSSQTQEPGETVINSFALGETTNTYIQSSALAPANPSYHP